MSKKSSMQSSWHKLCCVMLLVLTYQVGRAQHYNVPLDRYSRLFLLRSDSIHRGSFQGLPADWVDMDTIKGFEQETRYSEIASKLYDDHLINVKAEDLEAHIDLLLHFELGEERSLENEYQDTTRMSRNMRGFIIRADIGEKVSIETSFREHQSFVPYYLYQYTEESGVMPGTGRVKEFNATGRDHNIAEGYVAYSPVKAVNLQFGTQKNFIGSGYRSLLLSDNAYSYPQLKGSFAFLGGAVQYHVIHAWLQTLNRLPLGDTPESLFIRKDASFKYLEFHPLHSLSVGLFEGVMWDKFDQGDGNTPLPAVAYSPVIGTALASKGLQDVNDNVMVGLDLSYRPLKSVLLYGQYILDGDDRDGYQAGLRTIDLGVEGFNLGVEYNSVSPFTYSNSLVRQNQSHMGQAIAHPMGAGFDEWHVDLTYFWNRWFIRADYAYAEQLVDPVDAEQSCTTGGDIFSQQTCVITDTRPYENTLHHVDMRLGMFFNPRSNFNGYLGWMFRERRGGAASQDQSMFKFGIEMSLFNSYEDF